MTDIESLTDADAANELMRLAKQIAHHGKRYHAEDSPEISEADYAAPVRRHTELGAAIPQLIRTTSPTNQVGDPGEAATTATVPHAPRRRSPHHAPPPPP